jgi:hypothetical protein
LIWLPPCIIHGMAVWTAERHFLGQSWEQTFPPGYKVVRHLTPLIAFATFPVEEWNQTILNGYGYSCSNSCFCISQLSIVSLIMELWKHSSCVRLAPQKHFCWGCAATRVVVITAQQ